MPKRRADANSRRFFDEFASVRVSRLRASGVINPAKRQAVIPFPNGTNKLLNVAHTHLKHGGGWSFFLCPQCAKLAQKLYSIDDRPLCWRCCDAMNVKHRSRYGFGRAERLRTADQQLDQLIAKLETKEPLRCKPAPASWQGKAKLVYRSRRLTMRMRRRIVALRLHQFASQAANDSGGLNITRAFTPRKDALSAIPELKQVWRALTQETLERALDHAQATILQALQSSDMRQRIIAASLMLKTRAARQRGL
jgi:hypothetical protein